MAHIIILGAGMAGLGAAHKLYEEGIRSVLYEKNSYIGGHAASFESDGFVFDDGPHISFTKNKRIQNLLAESVQHQYEIIQAATNNYWKGYWIKHPAQRNLHGLPVETVVDVLHDFIMAQKGGSAKIETYKDWLYATFGRSFAKTFPMRYGLKYHTTSADNMTTDWIGNRLYKVDLKEVLHGALTPATPDVHYVNHFRYPSQGGFAAFLSLFGARFHVELKQELVAIDMDKKELTFANGLQTNFDHLISSLPLPDLVPMIKNVPADVTEASQKLSCTTCVTVNIGVDRPNLSDAHWTYFYDRDFVFTRLSFPHMLSSNNVPKDSGSIQAEIYYSDKYRPLDREPDSFIEPVVEDLKRCGILHPTDTILFSEARLIPYANVIFDLDRPNALPVVQGYLNDAGIMSCGRYGEWGYHWTDESFMSGEAAAKKIIESL